MKTKIRVKIDEDIEKVIRNCLKMFSNKYEFCEYFDISWKTYKGWFWKDCRTVPFEFLQHTCKLKKINVWDFLDGKELLGQTGGKGGRSRIIFNKNNFEKISNIIGWLLSDGSIHKNGRKINFSQKEITVLFKLLRDLNELNLLQKIPDIKPDGDAFYFEINSSVLSFLFINHLNLPVGKRSKFGIPKIIWMGNDEDKFSFLTGIFEGDGTFTGQDSRPVIHLEMNDIRFVSEVRHMLIKLGFNPTRISSRRNTFSFSLSRRKEIEGFMQKIKNFTKHPKTSEFLIKYGVAS